MIILYHQLEQGRRGPEDYWYLGKPFTGKAVELDAAGRLIDETEYVDGCQDGWDRSYYPEGQIAEECYYRRNLLHGVVREWYATGVLKREALFDFGFQIESKTWSESGELIADDLMDTSCDEFARYQAFRTRYANW